MYIYITELFPDPEDNGKYVYINIYMYIYLYLCIYIYKYMSSYVQQL
jgi:hypothetical protein